MFRKAFGKTKQDITPLLPTLHKLNETVEMLEKKEKLVEKKVAAEVEKAKQFTQSKNRSDAIKCLKRKVYERQIEQLGNFQLRIHDQMILLESANATTETVDALRCGTAAMKAMNKATRIDDLERTMDDINDQTESMKQIQEAPSAPIGAAADFDEDELEAELEELEEAELGDELSQPATTSPATSVTVYVPAGTQPTRTTREKINLEDDERALHYRQRWPFEMIHGVRTSQSAAALEKL